MKTSHPICLIVGLIVLSASCKTISKNKSKESFPLENKADSVSTSQDSTTDVSRSALTNHLNEVINYLQQNGYSTEYCFLIDMRISSGKNRFFVYDFRKNSVALSGLVAHGNCNTRLLELAR